MNAQSPNEEEHLLSLSPQWTLLTNIDSAESPGRIENRTGFSDTDSIQVSSAGSESYVEYKVYKRRWFGLIQLVLLNIIGSWGVRTEHSTTVKQVDG